MPECIQSYSCFKRTALQKFYFLTDTFQDIFERTVSQIYSSELLVGFDYAFANRIMKADLGSPIKHI